jgi:biotin carboxyl carrier protein
MEKLTIDINGKELSAEFGDDYSNLISINGKPYEVEMLKRISENIFSFAVNQRIYQIEIDMKDSGSAIISADGIYHEIDISNETKKLIKKYLQTTNTSGNASSVRIKAPMPGLVVKIASEAGMKINKGDKLMILEAMKMENAVTSSINGVVKEIFVREGSPVEKDQLLAEIEFSQ